MPHPTLMGFRHVVHSDERAPLG